MTELSGASHITPAGGRKVAACGMLVPNTSAKLIDVDGKSVGVYEHGELLIKGPQVMMGYLNNPEANEGIFAADGFMRTGDIAVMDEEGYFYIVDRLKELIKCKGFQVPPAQVEAALQAHEDVADAAVIGVEHERHGEVPKAFVVFKPGKTATEAALAEHCAKSLAEYKIPQIWEFLEAIPKSASGKILRRELRKRQ
mmetsp:Transcript_3533/g.7631  ORF Transcript_3533/g.7631 Transcript_3533/m.7631 type:complete len:197 (-) Transcript_3533:82-672(-)